MRWLSGSVTQPLTRRGALLIVATLSLEGCNPGSDLSDLAPYRPATYRLGAGDQIRIIVFGEDQLTGEFRVDDQGRIAIPLLGNVSAVGLTPQQLGAAISSQLRNRNFLTDPSVSVEVVRYRPVFVVGEVAKPGEYPFQPGMTVLTAIAVAGGYTYRAVQDYSAIVRTRDGAAVTGKVYPSSLIAPGDVVRVFERMF